MSTLFCGIWEKSLGNRVLFILIKVENSRSRNFEFRKWRATPQRRSHSREASFSQKQVYWPLRRENVSRKNICLTNKVISWDKSQFIHIKDT